LSSLYSMIQSNIEVNSFLNEEAAPIAENLDDEKTEDLVESIPTYILDEELDKYEADRFTEADIIDSLKLEDVDEYLDSVDSLDEDDEVDLAFDAALDNDVTLEDITDLESLLPSSKQQASLTESISEDDLDLNKYKILSKNFLTENTKIILDALIFHKDVNNLYSEDYEKLLDDLAKNDPAKLSGKVEVYRLTSKEFAEVQKKDTTLPKINQATRKIVFSNKELIPYLLHLKSKDGLQKACCVVATDNITHLMEKLKADFPEKISKKSEILHDAEEKLAEKEKQEEEDSLEESFNLLQNLFD